MSLEICLLAWDEPRPDVEKSSRIAATDGWRERQANYKDLGREGFEILQSQVDHKSLEDRLTLCSRKRKKKVLAGQGSGAGVGREGEMCLFPRKLYILCTLLNETI